MWPMICLDLQKYPIIMILRKLGPITIALVCVSTIASYILHITIYAEKFLKNTNFFVYTLFAARIKHEVRINNIMANNKGIFFN